MLGNFINYMLPPQDYRGLVLSGISKPNFFYQIRALLVKFLKTRQFDWIVLQNLDLFAKIVQTILFSSMTCRSERR